MSKISKDLKARAAKLLSDVSLIRKQVEENNLLDEEWYIKFNDTLQNE